jgi:histidine triad (HIT) family protein
MKRKRNNARPRVGALAAILTECAFCKIADGKLDAVRVFEDKNTLAFLDHRPLFPGHCLLITRQHLRTVADLSPALLASVFANVRILAIAVQNAMSAEGTFVAINNIVSQSVPHFHVHIVPRRKGDGLRGFMWPRHKYSSAAEAEAVGKKIRDEIARLQSAEDKH